MSKPAGGAADKLMWNDIYYKIMNDFNSSSEFLRLNLALKTINVFSVKVKLSYSHIQMF